MKRTRIVALVSTLCICLALLATGVWAAVSTVNFSLNGNLKYYPEGVYVELSGQVYRGDSLDTLEPITSDSRFTLEKQTNFDYTDGEPSGNFPIKRWDIGSLPFAPQLRFIKIEVNVTNYSDFEIIGTPTIKGIDASDSDITITDPGYVYAYKGETGTYELVLELKENANEITSQDITISFNIKEAEANYDYFTIENNKITGLDTEHYKEPYPEILIVPGVVKGGTTPLSIRDGRSSDHAFKGLNSSTVILQDGLTSIGSFAFKGCRSLESIEIPSSVTSIVSGAFYDCSSLTSVTIQNGVTSIGFNAFYECSGLTSIEIPSSVTSIGERAFYFCSSLTTITIKATTPPSLGSSAIPSNVNKIYVPSGSVSTYQSAWSSYSSKISAIQ